MSDLEKDLHYAMCESANVSEAEADRILDAIMPTIKPLGYTRTGLTDAQREAVDELRKYKANRSKTPVCVVDRILMAFMDGDTITPPEPTKPEKKIVLPLMQVERGVGVHHSALCDDGSYWFFESGVWKKFPPIPMEIS